MRKRFLLIHNPFAGLRGHTLAHRTARALEQAGASVVVIRTRGPDTGHAYEDLLSKVQISEFDAVLAAGGDGTVRALAEACAGTGVPVGIIPMGTGNVLAHEIGLSRKPREIVDVAINGPVHEIYGATINNEPFFLMAGIGFDGDVISMLNLNTKRRIGKLAYTIPLLRALAKSPTPFTVIIDGKAHKATWIVAANVSHYAGGFTIAPRASILQPELNAVVFQGNTRSTRFQELMAIAMGQLAKCKTASIVSCRELEIPNPASQSNMNLLKVEVDGDALGNAPVAIKAGAVRLNLIVPPDFTMIDRNNTAS